MVVKYRKEILVVMQQNTGLSRNELEERVLRRILSNSWMIPKNFVSDLSYDLETMCEHGEIKFQDGRFYRSSLSKRILKYFSNIIP